MKETQNLEIIFFEHHQFLSKNFWKEILLLFTTKKHIIQTLGKKEKNVQEVYAIHGVTFNFFLIFSKILWFIDFPIPLKSKVKIDRWIPKLFLLEFLAKYFSKEENQPWTERIKEIQKDAEEKYGKILILVPATKDAKEKTFDEEMIKKILKILQIKGINFSCSIWRNGKIGNCESLQPS